jgi:ubiquinone/menaquinone biosynthesis C-methylase UbiE
MTAAVERNQKLFSGVFGAGYSGYIERERLSRLVAVVIWGSDIRPYYASMRAIGDVPDESKIVDCPCGSGVALRGLHPEQRVRYLGFDLAPAMLSRARRRAAARGIQQAVFAEADASSLPLPDAEVDLFLSYFGLHCFDHPEAALHEAARCLRPSGELIGSTIVRGERLLDRLRVRPGVGGFGCVGDERALRGWLRSAGFVKVGIDTRGIFSVFSAEKP